jgi:hypothetical protein
LFCGTQTVQQSAGTMNNKQSTVENPRRQKKRIDDEQKSESARGSGTLEVWKSRNKTIAFTTCYYII